MKLTDIKYNPNNPRYISNDKLEKLKQSIKDFERMLALRPIVVDENNMVLGGNMRVKALEELGYKDIPDEWIKRANDLTEEEKRQFIIKDNVAFGAWDWDILANQWDSDELQEWGLEMLNWHGEDGYENEEINSNSLASKMILALEYEFEEYHIVKSELSKIAASPEAAVWQLLNLNDHEKRSQVPI